MHTCQFSPANFANSRSNIFSRAFPLDKVGLVLSNDVCGIDAYLSISDMHRSFSRCVPSSNKSRLLYSFSSRCMVSSGGR
jgi:hypothetical protein